MISNRPYLIRALYEWISDSGCTPYILVNALAPGCQVPETHVTDGRIVFNITHNVVQELILGNQAIEFTAQFSGVPTYIYLPIAAVTAIYAKENGEGMVFPEEAIIDGEGGLSSSEGTKGKPNLKIVK